MSLQLRKSRGKIIKRQHQKRCARGRFAHGQGTRRLHRFFGGLQRRTGSSQLRQSRGQRPQRPHTRGGCRSFTSGCDSFFGRFQSRAMPPKKSQSIGEADQQSRPILVPPVTAKQLLGHGRSECRRHGPGFPSLRESGAGASQFRASPHHFGQYFHKATAGG